jgi:hypothetical protein
LVQHRFLPMLDTKLVWHPNLTQESYADTCILLCLICILSQTFTTKHIALSMLVNRYPYTPKGLATVNNSVICKLVLCMTHLSPGPSSRCSRPHRTAGFCDAALWPGSSPTCAPHHCCEVPGTHAGAPDQYTSSPSDARSHTSLLCSEWA